MRHQVSTRRSSKLRQAQCQDIERLRCCCPTPVRSSGFFFQTHNQLKDMWRTIHVSHKDSERVSDDFVEDMRRRYGENSNQYRVRALGEFPTSDLDTVIPFELAHTATQREVFVPKGIPTVWALDVARFGDDWNVLMKRNRIAVLPNIKKWQGVDLMQTAGRVKREYDDTPFEERPQVILIDVIGLGAGVVDRLAEQGLPVRGINVAETPVHVHDFQATLLHLLGIDHERLTYKFQGRRFRLTDVHGNVVREILA